MNQTGSISRLSCPILTLRWLAPAWAEALARGFGLMIALAAAGAERPTIEVTAPNTVITQSCRVVIPPGAVIRDVNEQAVIRVGAPNIEIEFVRGSVLRGSPADTRPDE
jgi:hypothetical protein